MLLRMLQARHPEVPHLVGPLATKALGLFFGKLSGWVSKRAGIIPIQGP